MLGKTHIACGVAASLAIVQPVSMHELITGICAAAAGAVISDIDSDTSESNRHAGRIIGLTIALFGFALAEDYYHDTEILRSIAENSQAMHICMYAAAFMIFCIAGMGMSHRSMMHSLTALGFLSFCLYNVFPSVVSYFGIAFMSHLMLDLLNHKGEQLLFPLHPRFCLNICSSDGIINSLLFAAGSGLSILLIYIIMMGIG